ncbi:MAG: hypothetical protein ACI84R_000307 [Candidatus Azotimanducaceae bacterium]|jgi:hypothetical protein
MRTTFDFLCNGRGTAVSEALDTIRQTSSATGIQAGSTIDLIIAATQSDPWQIRDILRDHIAKNSTVAPGTAVLEVEITRRRYYTIYSLAAEVEIGNMVFEAIKTVPLIQA